MAYIHKWSQPSVLPHGAAVPYPALMGKWGGQVTPAPRNKERKAGLLFMGFPLLCLVFFASLAVGKAMRGLLY